MRNEDIRVGGRALRDFRVLSGERCAGIRETRGRSAGEWGDLRGLSADSDMTSGTWRQPRAVSVRAAETCAGQCPTHRRSRAGLTAEIQARMTRDARTGG